MTVYERVINSIIYVPIMRKGKTDLPPDELMTVVYKIKDYRNDTATKKIDFEATKNFVSFDNSQTFASARLIILSDNVSESNETLHVELQRRPNYYILGSPTIITIVIKDDSFVGI